MLHNIDIQKLETILLNISSNRRIDSHPNCSSARGSPKKILPDYLWIIQQLHKNYNQNDDSGW